MMLNNCLENALLVGPTLWSVYIFQPYLQDTYMVAHSTQRNAQLLANHLLYIA